MTEPTLRPGIIVSAGSEDRIGGVAPDTIAATGTTSPREDAK